ncbi:MAG TPA: glycosyl hydrolase, partial [Rhizomicrobium sp.]
MQSSVGKRLLPLLLCSVVFVGSCLAEPPAKSDALLSGFRNPPASARPGVGWPWMNGNVTIEGIDKDLSWMHRVGITSVGIGSAAIDTPTVVKKRLEYLTPEWKEAFRYAVGEADKYGIQVGIGAAAGWSMTGGPWVTVQQSMKKLVWSATSVEGGKPFHGVLPQPPDVIGPIQNAPWFGDHAPTQQTANLHFYRDAIVVAYRDTVTAPVVASATASTGKLNANILDDGDLSKGVILEPATEDGDVWVQVKYKKPATIQGVTLGLIVPKELGYHVVVEASNNGGDWRHVADFPQVAQLQRMQMGEQTISFAPVTARYFRLVLKATPPIPTSYRPKKGDAAPGMIPAEAEVTPHRAYDVREVAFRAGATVNEFEKKAMFAAPPRDFYTINSVPDTAPGTAIDPSSVVVLSDKMKPDGTLDWTPPPGKWVVMRLGYSPVGKENHPAPPEATGLEVDKLNGAHVRHYLERYIDFYKTITGPELIGKRGVTSIGLGSSEISEQNWTENIISEFKRLRGYDPSPWLPALTGLVVKAPADSDKFLWDWRQTVEDLFKENHYGMFCQVMHEHDLKCGGQALEDHRPTFGDDMDMRQYFDSVGAAMWTYDSKKFPAILAYEADIQGAASVAHIYGANLVNLESLTSDRQPWWWAPRDTKKFIDLEFALCGNRLGIHTSVHQPVDKPPGLSLGPFGQFFNRHETWAEMARPWLDYIARASWMLQQGQYVGDIVYFYGQEAPIVSLWGNKRVEGVPQGYAFDFANTDVLLNRLSVENGALVTKTGMRYRVLYLGGSSDKMTLTALKKVRKLVEQGAVIVGKRPVDTPSLVDDPAQWQAAADAVFGKPGETSVRALGQGKVIASGSLEEAFAELKVAPDFSYTGTDAQLLYTHRHLKDGDVYFVSNRENKPVTASASFRVAGRTPQLWDAITGKISPVGYRIEDGRTIVNLALPA